MAKYIHMPNKFIEMLHGLLLIPKSGLFDKDWYLTNNPDVAQAKLNPLLHYLRYGFFEGRAPGPSFSSKWYLEKNPDVVQAGVNPLVHYLRYGGFEGRDPSPVFSSKWYLDTYEDVKKSRVNPLLHFLKYGKKEGRKSYPSLTLTWPPLDLSKISWDNIQFDPIVVHNMGKVGSQTVKLSLTKAYEALGVVAPVYFTHALNSFELGRQIAAQESHQRDPKSRLVALEAGEAIRKKIDSDPTQHWNIVSLVRDPIARNVAAFFQNLQEYIPDWSERYAEGKLNAHEVQAVFMKVSPSFDDLDQFFDSQMKAIPAFGIDVYATPFPHDSGYTIFPGAAQASLLLIRLENMNQCIKNAIYEFLGFKDFTLHNTNVAVEKDYAPLYRAFKEIPLPTEYVNRIYKTQFARHFYSDAELEAFTRRWTHGAEKTRKNTSLNNAPA